MNEYVFDCDARNGQYSIRPVLPEQLPLADGTYFIAGQLVEVIQLPGDPWYSVEPQIPSGVYQVLNP